MEPVAIYGKLPNLGSGDGSGSGSGSGYGDGYGFGYGYGSGSGDGDGDGSGSGDGDGDGYGYGFGYGYGYGDGYGYGSGYGYGDGYGYGSGSGYGYGDGYGYGSGYGYGDGYGYGSGYGSGSGYGLKEATLGFVEMLPKIRRTRAKKLIRDGAKIAYWKSDINGKPANRGTGEPVHVGHIDVITGPVKLCTKAALHATYNLEKWEGDRIWLVALSGEIKEEQDKLGATQREILAELTGGKLL